MARRPFSLSAYMALARGRDRFADATDQWPVRPKGKVLWFHADTLARLDILLTLAKRLKAQRGDFEFVLTCDALRGSEGFPDALFAAPPPAETRSDIDRFLLHFKPDILIWAGNGLRPALLHASDEAGLNMLLVDAADADWRQPSTRWLPDATSGALSLFHAVFAQDEAAAKRLRRLGVRTARVEVTSPLEAEIIPLKSHDGLHDEMTAALAGRPVWLAAGLHADEIEVVLLAHRRAARLAHRLLLIVVPQDPAIEGLVASASEDMPLRTVRWDNGEMPDENTQVLVAGDDSELGLWYRLAPLCFLGGSLVGNDKGQSPLMAAALGSAILYGPNVGKHLDTYSRLVAAGAARIVNDTDSLSAAVSHLIAPDRAASMAHAGWSVVSAGAETSDMIMTQLEDWMDALGGAA